MLAGQDEAGRVCLGDLFAILVCICYSAALRHMGFFRLVFAFLSIRSLHAVRSAPVSTPSLAAMPERAYEVNITPTTQMRTRIPTQPPIERGKERQES